MAGGYAGKILQVNLTDRTFGTIVTEEYSDKFFGGFGIGTALFFDRDGVINVDRAYVHTREEFSFIDGIFDVARYAHCQDYKLIVITNQSGIGRGLIKKNNFL